MLSQAVIIAGGKGTRFRSISEDPKILMPLGNIKLIDFQINYLEKNNIKNIHFCLGYQSNLILEYLESLDINFTYSVEEKELGTYGALFNAKEFLNEEFFVLFGDVISNYEILNGYNQFKKNKSDFHLVLRYTDHPYDSDIVLIDKNNKVLDITRNNDIRKQIPPIGNSSLFFAKKKALSFFANDKPYDIFKNYLKENLDNYNITGSITLDYIKDIGTPERYNKEIKKYKKEIFKPYKIAFFDRDGTLIEDQGNESNPDKIKFNDEILKVIKHLQQENFKIILITNQPGIAKGFFNEEKLESFHSAMQYKLIDLELKPLDDIYFCIHHPDKGYKDEVKELKIKCECRKPGTKLIEDAIEDHNLNLSKAIYIGDSKDDYLLSSKLNIPFISFLSDLTDVDYFSANKIKIHYKGNEIINKIKELDI